MGKEKEYYYDAEELYVKKNRSQREIADLLGISEKTISEWSQKGEWPRQRKEYLTLTRTGPAEILKVKLNAMIANAGDEGLTPAFANTISQILSSIEKIQGGMDLKGAAIEVMDRFTKFVKNKDKKAEYLEELTKDIQEFFYNIKDT